MDTKRKDGKNEWEVVVLPFEIYRTGEYDFEDEAVFAKRQPQSVRFAGKEVAILSNVDRQQAAEIEKMLNNVAIRATLR